MNLGILLIYQMWEIVYSLALITTGDVIQLETEYLKFTT